MPYAPLPSINQRPAFATACSALCRGYVDRRSLFLTSSDLVGQQQRSAFPPEDPRRRREGTGRGSRQEIIGKKMRVGWLYWFSVSLRGGGGVTVVLRKGFAVRLIPHRQQCCALPNTLILVGATNIFFLELRATYGSTDACRICRSSLCSRIP